MRHGIKREMEGKGKEKQGKARESKGNENETVQFHHGSLMFLLSYKYVIQAIRP